VNDLGINEKAMFGASTSLYSNIHSKSLISNSLIKRMPLKSEGYPGISS